ncbi:GH92 family glycosyl hydrolase [Dysgonomonas sp. Marseille-P4361]|uniref:GH92 family glycosyl hydrolase n=1 Tax=Dysgonomonas sp. Marseille-P4361 TaxID=2161820 RepID=UPI000D555EE5|nr:GH92 family glycosyl hydrolase [Dysgonomonas sp. Marseille-P4361]
MKAIFSSFILLFVILTSCSSPAKSPIDYVDPFIGTGFHGHTYPGATVPYGAVQLSPDTRTGNWDACSGYHYSDSTIIGFSHTHLSGTGCADLADVLFHPTTKELKLEPKGYIFEPLAFSHKDEKASAGYYSVNFRQDGIKAELTATQYAGIHRYTFEKDKNSKIIIDHSHLLENEVIDMASFSVNGKTEVSGMRRTQGWVTNQYVYFVAQFSKEFEKAQLINNGKEISLDATPEAGGNLQMVLDFGTSDGTPVIVKVGISIVSEENARENLNNDVKDFDFDAVHQKARDLWTKALSDIVVEGGTEAQLKNFYTAQYHTKIVPNIASDVNGQYRRHDMSIGNSDAPRYSTLSLWDTFRAWNPLVTLTNKALVNDMVNSMLEMYQYSAKKELPIWPLSAGETGTMIGYHAVSVIGDAYMKGIRDYDIELAFEAMKRSSNINAKASDYYIKYGFIPSNIKRESVSCLLEYAYDDWVIAQVAKDLGKEEDYKEYMKRAHNYINVFDGATKFFRGKQMDGNWEPNFNPFEPARAYTEATAWQYRFFVPHDVNGMIQLFGGKDAFIEELDKLFTVEQGVDGEMVDITGLIGQYAHGNEPSHHMAYLYNYVGQPWKTQEMTRRILDEMYSPTPEGIIGNEDCGQMSAWYILTSLGMYPVAPGSNEFALTTPLFEKATFNLTNGKVLEIKANNPAKNIYIDKVILNGNEIKESFISYYQIMEGGLLEFQLSSTPNKERGTDESAYPHSMTEGEVVSIPYTTIYLNLFETEIKVDLGTATEGAEIYYTIDGTAPSKNTLKYESPFTISKTTDIKAIAFKEGFVDSRIFEIKATKAVYKNSATISGQQNGVNYTYHHGKFSNVAELAASKVVEQGTMSEPDIKNAKQEDHYGFVYTGYIHVPEDGVYGFLTQSDDGSVLYVAGEKVVDNDGSHAAIISTGEIALKAGYHPFKLLYFEDYEGQALAWKWRLPKAQEFVQIPVENLFTK